MNYFVKNLLEQCEERFSEDSVNMTMTEWITKNTTMKDRPFHLKRYEFQEKILNDMHPNMDVIKPSQVGLTEAQIRKALAFLKRNNGTSLIYSLPTEDMYKRISKARIKPIVDKDKVFNSLYDRENKAIRAVDMMQFGQSFLYIVPSIESAATSINADFVMNDEVDLSDQKMISLFNSRLQGSDWRISQRFSTPSFPSYGVDLSYQISDQHEYLCHCESCGHWNAPEFNRKFINVPGLPDHIVKLADITVDLQDELDLVNAFVMCEKCRRPLDLGNARLREWVPNYPSRTGARGYKITPFVTDRLNVEYIIRKLWDYQKNEYLRGWYNTVLGLPYSDGSIQVPIEDILACMTNEAYGITVDSYEDVWVGIDMGQTCHIILGKGPNVDNLHIFKMYSTHVDNIVSEVQNICKEYSVRGGSVDRHPYEPTARDIFRASGGRIVPVEYRGLKELNLVLDDYDELAYAQVNRTLFLDHFATKIRKHSIKISGYGHNKQVFIDHIRDMVRDESPERPAEWKKLHGNDHFFHAGAFMAIAPKITELVNLTRKDDNRLMVLGHVVSTQSSTSALPGMTKKKVVETLGVR